MPSDDMNFYFVDTLIAYSPKEFKKLLTNALKKGISFQYENAYPEDPSVSGRSNRFLISCSREASLAVADLNFVVGIEKTDEKLPPW